MARMKYIGLYVIISVLAIGCIDEIDLNIDNEMQFVNVDGLISDRLDTQVIKLDLSPIIGVGNDNILEPITGASVIVKDDSGQAIPFDEDVAHPGQYKSYMAASQGRTYHVEATLPDGKVIKSIPTPVNAAVGIDSIYSRTVTDEFINFSGNKERIDFVELYLNTDYDPSDIPFLRWRVKGVYEFKELYPRAFNPRRCYVTEKVDLNNISIFNGFDFTGNELKEQFMVKTQVNLRFNILYAFTVEQYRMSEREYNFWHQADQLINIEGTLFDLPPGTIKGNLYNENDADEVITGYFSVVSKTVKRAFVTPNDIGYQPQSDCTSLSFRPNPERCANCLLIFNSTLDKPEYWPY